MSKEKQKKSWYTKWWAIILFLLAALYFLSFFNSDYQTNKDNYSDSNIQDKLTNMNKTQSDTYDYNYSDSNIQDNKELTNTNETSLRKIIFKLKAEFLEEYGTNEFSRDFKWRYNEHDYGVTFNLYPKIYEVFKKRERKRDYDLFASDYYSKTVIKTITTGLKNYAKENDLTDEEIPYFIISFVQSLPYTSDDVTTGFDEYPRFPYETIYDNGGDCEDTSILVTAMLKELNYSTVLLQFPGHMAVGILCEPSAGQTYYTYQGNDFCYLETAGDTMEIGKAPSNVKKDEVTIHTIVERPVLDIKFTSNYKYNSKNVYVDVNFTINNLGSKKAENVKIYVALQTSDKNKVWDSIETENVQIEPEGFYKNYITNLHSPTGQTFRVYIKASGDNVVFDESQSEWIYLK